MSGKKIYNLFLNLYKLIIILMTSSLFIIVGTNVFSRYILNTSLGWADELARFVFIWVSFLGAVLAYHENEHVGLDFIVERIPVEKVKKIVKLLADLFVFIVVFFLTKYGWIVADSATNVSPGLYIPMKIVYMIVPVSAILMLFLNISKIFFDIKTIFNSNS